MLFASLALALIALSVPLAGTAAANHGTRSLDLNPESSNAALRARVKLLATLEDEAGNPSPATGDVTIYFEVDGPGDPGAGTGVADGTSFGSPDLRCNIAAGEDRCRDSYANVSGNTGDDTIWAWISDTTPDDAEGLNAKYSGGLQLDPDGTDVVTATWFAGLPSSATLDCNPDVSTAVVGSSKTFECDVSSRGTPLNGWDIDAENLSPAVNDPDNSASGSKKADYDGTDPRTQCVTGDSAPGRCRMTIPSESPAQAGLAQICFWVDEEGDNSFHPEVDVEWDGALCDTEAVGAPERDNRTDKVALYWKLRRTISLSSSKSAVYRGRTFRLSGMITRTSSAVVTPSTCVAAQRVLIRRDVLRDGRPDHYELFRSLTTGAEGRYRTKVKAYKSANYRASVVPTYKCFMASSLRRTVRIKS
jgi:hypothetical protein